MLRNKKIRRFLLLTILLTAVLLAVLYAVREKIREDRIREAEENRISSVSLDKDRFCALSGEAIRLSAQAVGGIGNQQFTFYYYDDDRKVIIQESSTSSVVEFVPPKYGVYQIFVDVDDESPMTAGMTASTFCGGAHRGLDVSQYQKNVDWGKVRNDGYDFVMIRSSFGKEVGQEDLQFARNIRSASDAGLNVGTYHYSYALTPEDAEAEARYLISVLEPYHDLIRYPVALDFELVEQRELPRETIEEIVRTFCTIVEEEGYQPMVYSYDSWLYHYHQEGSFLERIPVWTACWNKAPDGSYPFVIWQDSNEGMVDGISGAVDLDYSFF